MLRDLPRDLITLLRYVAPPVVGGVVVWAFDSDHNVFAALTGLFGVAPSIVNPFWVLAALLGVVGVTTFSLHRAVFMYWVGRAIHARLTADRRHEPSLDELDFSRWRRRVAPLESPERGAQSVLDQANAAVDLFYCCAWNSAVLVLILRLVAWTDFTLTICRWWGLVLALCVFLAIGLWAHFETSRRDLVAYDRFDGLRKNLLLRMLRDERFPNRWRKLDTLRHAIASDAESTKQLLLEIGARASEDGQDLWGLLEYHPISEPMPNHAMEPSAPPQP